MFRLSMGGHQEYSINEYLYYNHLRFLQDCSFILETYITINKKKYGTIYWRVMPER
jgi:hypothetical protein